VILTDVKETRHTLRPVIPVSLQAFTCDTRSALQIKKCLIYKLERASVLSSLIVSGSFLRIIRDTDVNLQLLLLQTEEKTQGLYASFLIIGSGFA
jgi:hypothetical protein